MSYSLVIAWGDCDAAGIVFYPNYFRWFDTSYQHLLRAKGLDQRLLSERYGIIGTPIADADARFHRPASFGDLIDVESHISEWTSKLFTVTHVVLRAGDVIAEGHELRFWGVMNTETGKLSAGEIDPGFRDLLEG